MNCEKCKAQKVCFVQKQIEGLAERMTQNPFYKQTDAKAARSTKMFLRHEEMMKRRFDIDYKLKEVIASNCSLFSKGTE